MAKKKRSISKKAKSIKNQKQGRSLFRIALLVVLAIVALLAVVNNGGTSQIAARGGSGQPTSYAATVSCEECAANGTQVQVWAGPDLDYGGEQVGSIAHNTRVSVLDRNGNATLVQANGVYGWVHSNFIQR